MKTEVNNVVIKNVHKEDGAKIIEYFQSLGVDTRMLDGSAYDDGYCDYFYYGVINNIFNNYKLCCVISNNAKIIELPQNKYPKRMHVSDNPINCPFVDGIVVVGEVEFNGKTLYITDNFNHNCYNIWRYAKDMNESNVVELTLEEIANKFNIPIENVRIKD